MTIPDREKQRIIRNARLNERSRRNNAWSEDAELAPRQNDEEIVDGATRQREYERLLAALCGL